VGPERPRGVTPVLRGDYARRTADRQAAFVLPYLEPGMAVLDVGCGPGTITVGLAAAVAPGRVVGVDYDAGQLASARSAAASASVDNVSFEHADVSSLPFPDATFDLVFENDVLVHLGGELGAGLAQIRRVVRPGGLFAARDAAADAAVWGGQRDGLDEFDDIFFAWHRQRGSDIMLGRRLRSLLRGAGFEVVRTSVSADVKGTPDEVSGHGAMMLALLDGPLGAYALEAALADAPTIERLRLAVRRWADDPDSFFANVHVEVIGRRASL